MNLLNKYTKGEIELIERAGVILKDKDYTEEEIKKCGNEIIDYIMAHSTKKSFNSILNPSQMCNNVFKLIKSFLPIIK